MHLDRIDPRHAREALFAIDPGCTRDEWHRIGRGAIAAGLDLETLVDWSAKGDNFKGERDVRAAFRTIRADGGTGIGSLWKAATAAGWRPPKEDEQRRQRPAQAPGRPQAAPARPRPGMGAAEVWSRCKPASAEHGYIVAKQGNAAGLRVVPEGDPLRVAGLSMAGALAQVCHSAPQPSMESTS